jgi:hypothetical protein
MDCKADGFIEKPVDMGRLAELVKEKVGAATIDD